MQSLLIFIMHIQTDMLHEWGQKCICGQFLNARMPKFVQQNTKKLWDF